MSFEKLNNNEEITESQERQGHSFGKPLYEETSEEFPGSKVVLFEKDGKVVRYALRRNATGQLEGNKFTLQEKKNSSGSSESYWANSGSRTDAAKGSETFRIGPVYQMHEEELSEMEEALKSAGVEIV